MVLFLLIVVEAVSFIALELLIPEGFNRFFRMDMEVLGKTAAADFDKKEQDIFDPEIGWDLMPGKRGGSPNTGCQGKDWFYSLDERGSREIPGMAGDRLISLYGDSYTFGAEVDNDETWQYHLSGLTGSHVDNFGVWGYGPDQALLKLKKNLDKGLGTPVVVLGVYSEDVRRIVGTYRPFLTGQPSPIEFKPALVGKSGTYEWETGHMMQAIGRDAFIQSFESAKEHDFWYALNEKKPRRDFPYTWAAAKLFKFVVFDYYLSTRNMWNHPLAQDIFREILTRFLKLAQQYDFLPVLVMMPEAGELEGHLDGKPSYYGGFVSQLRQDPRYRELVVVDVYEEQFDARRFTHWDDQEICHPSPYGNQVIAEAILKQAGEKIRVRMAAAQPR